MSDPKPPSPKRIRVVVMSASRCGTMGLYTALKTLGYSPCHMYEMIFVHGEEHLRKLSDAMEAEQHRGQVPAMDIDDFLAGQYDAFVEIGSFFPLTTLHCYLPDPNVKWILAERDPARWVSSLDETVAYVYRSCSAVDARVLGVVDPWFRAQRRWLAAWFRRWGGRVPGEPGYKERLQSSYLEYNELVKSKVPADRLLNLKLEDGFGWNEICDFLDHPVPKEQYPSINDRTEFRALVDGLVKVHKLSAMRRMAVVLAPIFGVATYLYWLS
ncbi:uncharacterized protein PgNI_07782 [Pyricularia grisea]|uniref:NAD dependent epimerase/dehydratase n=1 Tax=Pyricularia grisea TaxID=148305 RepID=A0A6P8B1T0_PYRGI|nr:uncharacterized protein PgNI_07782 [Pyricularia grisea]TLD08855.1 hypothetical protein PgNI_07782 [Pyricularia grisea]